MASTASASLIGESVTGEINFAGGSTNFFDPANGFVPASTLNSSGTTVTIGDPDVEFGIQDPFNFDSADFSANGVVISDEVLLDAINNNWTMTFTSSAFTGLTLTEVSDDFLYGGVTGTLSGDTLTFSWAGGSVFAGEPMTAIYTLAAVPLPAGGLLLLTGAGALGLFGRRRRKTP